MVAGSSDADQFVATLPKKKLSHYFTICVHLTKKVISLPQLPPRPKGNALQRHSLWNTKNFNWFQNQTFSFSELSFLVSAIKFIKFIEAFTISHHMPWQKSYRTYKKTETKTKTIWKTKPYFNIDHGLKCSVSKKLSFLLMLKPGGNLQPCHPTLNLIFWGNLSIHDTAMLKLLSSIT